MRIVPTGMYMLIFDSGMVVKMLLPEDPDPVQTCHEAFIICLGKCDFG